MATAARRPLSLLPRCLQLGKGFEIVPCASHALHCDRLHIQHHQHLQHLQRQFRPFSSSGSRRASRSLRVAGKESPLPMNDVGVAPGTFIFPSLSHTLFSLLSSLLPSRRHTATPFSPRLAFLLLLPYRTLKHKVLNLFSLAVYKYSSPSRLELRLRQVRPHAVALHRQMYTSFAAGDTAALKPLCASGLYTDFASRIFSRPKGESWAWSVVRYNSRAKVMSHRGMSFGKDNHGIRQAVVRINSRQVLTRYHRDGTMIEGSGKEKDVLEYLVVQRLMVGGKEGPWMVWGTTEETTLEKMQELEREERGLIG